MLLEQIRPNFCGLCAFQCDRIGLFLKGLGEKLDNKSSPNIWQLLGYFEVCHFLRKTNLITFWVSIGNFGLLLIPISGHTVCKP